MCIEPLKINDMEGFIQTTNSENNPITTHITISSDNIKTQKHSLSVLDKESKSLQSDTNTKSDETKDAGKQKSQEESVGAVTPAKKSVFTLEEVSNHCGPSSCWIVLWDHVYDVTKFIKEHPGGEDIIYEHGGHDATFAFRDVGHSNDALLLITQFKIGELVEHERIFKRKKMDSCPT